MCFVDDLAGVHRRERDLGGRNHPEIVTLDGVSIVGELGKVAGGGQGGRAHHGGRTDLLEHVGVAIESQLAQRSSERRTGTSLHGEHRRCDLGGPLAVEDSEFGRCLPVRNPLVIGERGRHLQRTLDERVLVVTGSVGCIGMRQIGDAQQHFTKFGLDLVGLGGQSVLFGTEVATLGLRRVGRRLIARPLGLTHGLRQFVDLGTNRVATRGDLTGLNVECDGDVELFDEIGLATAGESRTNPVGVATEKPNIDHRNTRLPSRPLLGPVRSIGTNLLRVTPPTSFGTRIVSGSIDNVVEVHDLTVRYGRGERAVTAVDGVSFGARAGQVTAVLGPNGAGKTSTIEVCEGLRRRSSGQVRVLGLDPGGSRRDRRALAHRTGLMLQEGGVYPSARPIDVVRQYCGIHGVADPNTPRALIDLVGLTDRARTSWRRLSGGEKQRLSLALALVGTPDVVFLDEPTSGVDVNGRDTIRGIIRSLTERGCGVVLATHELDEAERIADRVVIFDKGKVLVEGTLDDVRKARQAVRLRTLRPLVLADVPSSISDWLVEVEPGHYTIEDAPQGLVAALAVWLSEHGIDVIELRAGLSSLEDVFKRLTGGAS